eukprot:8846320-Ditylum_brightwellii.AAC.1
MLHGTSLATLLSYDIYKEVCVQYWEFRDGLSTQMCCYNPIHCSYPGDGHMRPSASQNLSKRRASESASIAARAIMSPTRKTIVIQGFHPVQLAFPPPPPIFWVKHLKDAKTKHSVNSRLYEDLNDLKRHILSVLTGKQHGKACRMCGKMSYSMCTVCRVSLHFLPTTRASAGAQCFFDYHNGTFFGMAQEDAQISGIKK